MKTLTVTILILILSNPALAWNDYTDEWNEEIRQAEEENYRNRMRALEEDLLLEKAIENNDRIRRYYEGSKTFPER